ncbi:MAG: NifB/NifX family molybdenum-iron cluster-binding protein [Candidatus Nanoarchaeia archaeon]|nr:NifB/NifX family molybdenum-iron cluster-binding protein [Candidatus Nanoarchaeia archaeon]
MKIAVSSTKNSIESQPSPFFGRCDYFIILDIENNEIKNTKAIKNDAVMQPGGAGVMSAQTMGNEKVDAVISNSFGPRAFDILSQLNIKKYKSKGKTVKEDAELFIKGELEELKSPGMMGVAKGRFRRGFN